MIRLKNKEDIIQIKEAIRIGEFVLDEIKPYLNPSITTSTINDIIEIMITDNKAFPSFKNYKGFPFASCISINEEIIHGLPSERKLKDEDIVKIDVGIKADDFFSDQARTYWIGNIKDYRYYELINSCQEALTVASSACKAGNNLTNVSKTITEIANQNNLGILLGFGGHGVGFSPHEEPYVPNDVPYVDLILVSGMILAIEPMFVLGKGTSYKSENGWTIISDGIGSHFEKTIIID
jgi:methionyl aminopeptidase